ncbi:MAG TPA: RDD family protein [Propionicimonas sp.]|nr:RDD family protein [Propionicimonas sp.]HRA07331.1 RDD family protein [Propionicimonas sp.]
MTAPAKPRLLAGLIDLALALAWVVVVAAVGVLLYLNGMTTGVGPLVQNLVGLLCVVVPVTLGLTLAECGRYEATPGKLKFGLRVRTVAGERITWPRSLLRNLLKLGLPWTLAHAGAIGVAYGGGWDAQLGASLSLLVPVAYLASLFFGSGRTIYDHLAGTVVIETAPGRRFAD